MAAEARVTPHLHIMEGLAELLHGIFTARDTPSGAKGAG